MTRKKIGHTGRLECPALRHAITGWLRIFEMKSIDPLKKEGVQKEGDVLNVLTTRDGIDAHLSTFTTDSSGQLDVLRHDGYSLGVDGAQVGVLEQADQVGFRGLLQVPSERMANCDSVRDSVEIRCRSNETAIENIRRCHQLAKKGEKKLSTRLLRIKYRIQFECRSEEMQERTMGHR